MRAIDEEIEDEVAGELSDRARTAEYQPKWYTQWDAPTVSAAFQCCGVRYAARDKGLLEIMRAAHVGRAHAAQAG